MSNVTPVDLGALKRVAGECPFETPGGYCKACQNALHHCACAARAHYRNAVRNPAVVLAIIAELEQLRAEAPKWIACVDELPDSDTLVLIGNFKGSRLMAEIEFTDDSEGHGKPYWVSGGFDLPLSDYPFWMPLPSPPEAVNP